MGVLDTTPFRALVLLSVRLMGLVLLAPVFSSRALPVKIRSAVVIVLALALLPAVLVGAEGGTGWGGVAVPRLDATALVSEALVGMVLGLGAAVLVAAAQLGGDLLAVQMGLSGENVLDPTAGTQVPVLGQFLALFVTALFFSAGGHLLLLQTLASSLRVLPLGARLDLMEGIPATVAMLGAQFVLGIRFAAPVVAAMMIGNAALGVMGRAVPQLNVLMVAFPLQIGIGLLTLGLSLSLVATLLGDGSDPYLALVDSVLGAYAPATARP